MIQAPLNIISHDRIIILNDMVSLYSLCLSAYKIGLISSEELVRYELRLRHEAFEELLATGLDMAPAQVLIDDQFMGFDYESGEVVL